MVTLVGNKIDLENRQVTQQEGEDYAKAQGLQYMEVSAKQNIGVESLFKNIAKLLPAETANKKKANVSLSSKDKVADEGYCAC